ncbi:TM0106 family RecB-like putative nuclease [Phormidium tenue FACHB-886]|nr:TM0106 family RecB-like putative nuclease [Phormidium tenue FACHB-886]
MWLTDELLFNYQRCPRRAFLDACGDPSLRDRPSDYLLKLRQDSLIHRHEVLSEAPFEQPNYPKRDWLAGAEATLALMQQGVDRIAGGVLLLALENGINLVSCPDLLVKQPGYSIWGDWVYVPVDIRLGKRPKLDYQIAAAFHAYVLAGIQGIWSETSWLILRQRGAYAVNLLEVAPRMEELLQSCMEALLQSLEPEVFIAHSRCDLCHWFSHCHDLAQRDRHLSLLPGVTPSRYAQLKALGLVTLEAIATATPKRLESLPGFGAQVATRLIRQAQATLYDQAIAHYDALVEPPVPLLSRLELPTAPIELYFDIEAAPEKNLVYLHGVLVVDRLAQTETFYPLLAENQQEEEAVWQQFLALVWQYPDAPIFHFCPYEVQTVKRLGDYYGSPAALIEPLLTRFVDLHERVTRVAILPVESYALKPIARWLGFDWRDADANGAQSICWYDQWLQTGDRSFLNAILRYNEDDCRATYRVKDWLVEFCQGDLITPHPAPH